MKRYNLYILTLLFLLTILFNIIYIFNSINYHNKTIINEYNYLDENIVFFGDSITYGYDLKEYINHHKVVNKGISGNKTEDLIKRLDDVYSSNPTKVFILIGVNDIIKQVEFDDIINNYQIIIDGIKENRKNAKIYVESIYPTNTKVISEKGKEKWLNANNDKIIELNERIKKLCNKNNLTYINMHDELTDEEGELKELYTYDGLHISHLGYLKITTVLDKYLKED